MLQLCSGSGGGGGGGGGSLSIASSRSACSCAMRAISASTLALLVPEFSVAVIAASELELVAFAPVIIACMSAAVGV